MMGEQQASEVLLCAACGLAGDGATCHTCGALHGAARPRAEAQPKDGYFVGVQASFTCNACRFNAPLNHFDEDGAVVCTHCGLAQRYELERWAELVDLADEVGDLGAGGPDGRFPDPQLPLRENPHARLSERGAWARRSLAAACPGNPLCRQCRGPVVVAGRDGARLDIACPRCGDRRAFELPESVRGCGRLAGVVADEHEVGGVEAKVEAQASGVALLRCPNCSGVLEGVSESAAIVTCGFCQATCRVSTPSHARAGHKGTPAKTWWLYFEGPSAFRAKLLDASRASAAADRQRAEALTEKPDFELLLDANVRKAFGGAALGWAVMSVFALGAAAGAFAFMSSRGIDVDKHGYLIAVGTLLGLAVGWFLDALFVQPRVIKRAYRWLQRLPFPFEANRYLENLSRAWGSAHWSEIHATAEIRFAAEVPDGARPAWVARAAKAAGAGAVVAWQGDVLRVTSPGLRTRFSRKDGDDTFSNRALHGWFRTFVSRGLVPLHAERAIATVDVAFAEA
jgi:hypothetical protein